VSPTDLLSDERARELAREILSRPEYARFRPSVLLERFADWLSATLNWLSALYEVNPALWYVLFLGLVGVALALLAHVVWSVRVALRAAPPAPERRPAGEPPAFDREAEHLAADGRMLEAAHAMHLACIGRLLRSGALVLRRHDPNRTLRLRVAGAPLAPELRRDFAQLLDQLEARWFRDPVPQPRDRELFESWRSLNARLGATEALR